MRQKRYENLDQVNNLKTMADMRRWMKERRSKIKDLSTNIPQEESKQLAYIRTNRSEQAITWIGHSTFLVQMGGLNILTDPVWARRMGLQRRLTEPGIALDDMPEIDVVVISHGHYDHLDFPTLRRLKGNPLYLVPVGLRRLFQRKGFTRVVELSWWEEHHVSPLVFTFVPAQHWTRRTLIDTNRSHWGGWIMRAADEGTKEDAMDTVYFVGDTGYFRGFQLIAERYRVDTVLMPIGAYEPEWFMASSHINPEDAVRAFQELGGKRFIPMHYGTYRLADDTGPEALDRLHKAWESYEGDGSLHVLKLGGTLKIGTKNYLGSHEAE
jgi:L-ascorbate metabolism protein UlaG (beta-lactamase superfamily)